MKIMNKHIIYTSVFVIFLIFILPVISLLPISYVPGNTQPGFIGRSTKNVYGDITVKQEFVSIKNNLSGIGLSIKNPSNANHNEIFVKVFTENGIELRSTSLNGYSIQDGSFVKFIFDPIVDSKNKNYYFEVSSKDSSDLNAMGPFWEENKGLPAVYYFKPANQYEKIKEVYINLFSRFLHLRSQTL